VKCELRNIRTSKEYDKSIMEFAVFLGVNYNTYQGWETNRSYPSLRQAIEIAEKLKRRVDDIWHK
jgi:DNA-binding XRE family transcriptional regulator